MEQRGDTDSPDVSRACPGTVVGGFGRDSRLKKNNKQPSYGLRKMVRGDCLIRQWSLTSIFSFVQFVALLWTCRLYVV